MLQYKDGKMSKMMYENEIIFQLFLNYFIEPVKENNYIFSVVVVHLDKIG